MKIVAYEGVVENGRVQLPVDALIPDKSTVYVVVPGIEAQRTVHVWSPHLADKSQAALFELEVSEEETHA